MIGNGKKKRRFNKLIIIVFLKRLRKSGFVKNRSKWAKPTHSLFNIPRKGEYSWKDIIIPHMGTYLKIRKNNNPGSIKKYKYLSRLRSAKSLDLFAFFSTSFVEEETAVIVSNFETQPFYYTFRLVPGRNGP
jgi:hypothetical protein